MTVTALCQTRSTRLLIFNAIESAGLTCGQCNTHPDRAGAPERRPESFLMGLSTQQPHYVLITSEYLNDPSLFEEAKRAAPTAQLILCLLPNAVETIANLWPVLDTLEFDVLCSLPDLTNCLTTLQAGHFYKSA